MGQARKSLWIETSIINISIFRKVGQARKSLWIETFANSSRSLGKSRSGS